jgi:hypothetical protein
VTLSKQEYESVQNTLAYQMSLSQPHGTAVPLLRAVSVGDNFQHGEFGGKMTHINESGNKSLQVN